MIVSMKIVGPGTLEVTVDGEAQIALINEMHAHPVVLEFPKPVVIRAEEDPLTGFITLSTDG